MKNHQKIIKRKHGVLILSNSWYILRFFFKYVAGKIKTITNRKKQGKKKMENVTEKNISKSNDEKPKVGFIVGNEWLRQCDRIPKVQHRVGFWIPNFKINCQGLLFTKSNWLF